MESCIFKSACLVFRVKEVKVGSPLRLQAEGRRLTWVRWSLAYA
jgi:hypothetical protein